MTFPSIGIIGAGDIGFTLAELLALRGYDIIIYNRYHEVEGRPGPVWLQKLGKVKDLNDALQLPGSGNVYLTHNLDDLDECETVVITAGAKRSNPEETREELAGKNARVMQHFVPFIAKNPETLILIVSNPVDSLAQILIQGVVAQTGREASDVASTIAGVSYIDTMRLKNVVREFLVDYHPSLKDATIEGLSLGEHGPSMVPLSSHVTINGAPLTEFASTSQIDEMVEQTVLRGSDIIKLTGASSIVGPAHAVMHMILEIAEHPSVELPCSVWDGTRSIGKMAEFTGRKITKVVNVPMTDTEAEKLRKSETTLDAQYQTIYAML